MKTKLDWSAILLNLAHLALIGGNAYLAIAHPAMLPAIQPYLQAAGQALPTPAMTMTYQAGA